MKKSIQCALVAGALAGAARLGYLYYKMHKKVKSTSTNNKRLNKYYEVLNLWMDMKRRNASFDEFFSANDIKTVAIYGMGELGMHLYYDLLEQKSVEVKYCIDNFMKDREECPYKVYTTDELDESPEVDAIIVTPMHVFDEIEDVLIPYCSNIIPVNELFEI